MASSARARGLGAELRDARKAAGFEAQDVGRRLDWSKATMSRIESGQRRVDETEVSAILAVLGVTGEDRDRLLNLARELDQRGWWESGATTGLPSQLTALLGFEREASRITELTISLIPGLLQTYEYARAVMVDGGVPAAEVDTRVAVRIGRQNVVTGRTPAELITVIDESALRRPVGTAAVMSDQLQELIKLAELPHIEVRVLPLGIHPGIDGSFVLFEFPKATPIVHLEHYRSSAFLDEADDVAAYSTLRDSVLSAALSTNESLEVLSACADQWRRENV